MENIYVCQRCFHKFNKNNGYNFINGRGPYCDSCYTFLGGKKSGTPLIVDLIKTGKSLGLRRIGLLLLPFSLGFYTLICCAICQWQTPNLIKKKEKVLEIKIFGTRPL